MADECLIAQLLSELKTGDIMLCDECECYALRKHMHMYIGSMGKEINRCPECDLPPLWHSKFSKDPTRNGRRFYVFFDPKTSARHVQWGHPTEGNPLYITGDRGEVVTVSRKRKSGPSGLVRTSRESI